MSKPDYVEFMDVMDMVEAVNSVTTKERKIHVAAHHYIKMGLYVVPIVKNGKALPPKKYGITYGNAARSPKVIEKWFNPDDGIFKGWNIGIATGKEGGVFALDVDTKNNGDKTLEEFVEQYGELPEGPVQRTPSGGFHYI